jgi:aconitate hydratase
MLRGTFANLRLRNRMLPPGPNGQAVEGGLTLLQPGAMPCTIFEAAQSYQRSGTPCLVFAGHDYGSGSSRDWAAKGTRLLGVRAVVARSFERIHRANLVGMGVLPLQFPEGEDATSLGLVGDELFDLLGLDDGLRPGQAVRLRITRANGQHGACILRLRIDTASEVAVFQDGGLLPHVLRGLLRAAEQAPAPPASP